jgi:hypothetical protein
MVVATFVSDNNFQISKNASATFEVDYDLKHTNNDDLIIMAILMFNSTLRAAF